MKKIYGSIKKKIKMILKVLKPTEKSIHYILLETFLTTFVVQLLYHTILHLKVVSGVQVSLITRYIRALPGKPAGIPEYAVLTTNRSRDDKIFKEEHRRQ